MDTKHLLFSSVSVLGAALSLALSGCGGGGSSETMVTLPSDLDMAFSLTGTRNLVFKVNDFSNNFFCTIYDNGWREDSGTGDDDTAANLTSQYQVYGYNAESKTIQSLTLIWKEVIPNTIYNYKNNLTMTEIKLPTGGKGQGTVGPWNGSMYNWGAGEGTMTAVSGASGVVTYAN